MRSRDLVAKWVDAFNRGDTDEIADLYAEICIPEDIFEYGSWGILKWRETLGLRGCGFFAGQVTGHEPLEITWAYFLLEPGPGSVSIHT
jgi:hypothetical protein